MINPEKYQLPDSNAEYALASCTLNFVHFSNKGCNNTDKTFLYQHMIEFPPYTEPYNWYTMSS